tara:strand:+ start:2077 stop:2472 length:396 start_codon:yes stop_codon:yes gene_type:complete
MKILGIDYGTKKIGIATSDVSGTLAFPHSVIANNANTIPTIVKLCDTEPVEKIIIGKSIDFKRKENPLMEDIRKFVGELCDNINIPIEFFDETLSTQEAKRLQENKNMIDASAAALVLQSYIDASKYRKND